VAPGAEPGADTRPLWLALLIGLAAGAGLTGTAAIVVDALDRRR
jgi:hypothetical protein